MPNPFTLSTYDGMHATVMGLGRFAGGVAAARFLTQHGAVVTVTDLRSAEDLAGSIEMLSDLPIARFALDGHPDDVLADCQLLVVNPAVRPDQPLVTLAESRQIDVTTEIELFLRHCPAFVISVTGSNGKSTITDIDEMYHEFLPLQKETLATIDADFRSRSANFTLPTVAELSSLVKQISPR